MQDEKMTMDAAGSAEEVAEIVKPKRKPAARKRAKSAVADSPAETTAKVETAPRKPRAPRKKAADVQEPAPEKAVSPEPDLPAESAADTLSAEPVTPIKVLYVGAEVMPFAATGGLGDVMGSLPLALKKKYGEAADIRVITPLYESIPPEVHAAMRTEAVFTVRLAWRQQYCGILSLVRDGVTFYFVDNEYYFKRGELYGHFDDGERFAYFCKSVLEMMPHIGFFPDILHANDWQSALSVVYLSVEYCHRLGYEHIRSVFTIHNIEYQGQYSFDILQDVFDIAPEHAPLMAYDGCINLVKAAIQCAHRVTTVSPTYAQEIMTPAYSHRLHFILSRCGEKVSGILNGIDTDYYNPATDRDIPCHYTAEDPSGKTACKLAFQRAYCLPEDADAPVIAVISRLVAHKGIDLITGVICHILDTHPHAQFVVLGTGEGEYESFFRQLENERHDRVRSFILYDRALSKKIYAAADIFLMPSRSEPCGLSQMIACRYGAVPVVRETGGLYDSIHPYYEDADGMHGNGFTFANYAASELEERVNAALALYGNGDGFAALRRRSMQSDFSWDASAGRYMDLYRHM